MKSNFAQIWPKWFSPIWKYCCWRTSSAATVPLELCLEDIFVFFCYCQSVLSPSVTAEAVRLHRGLIYVCCLFFNTKEDIECAERDLYFTISSWFPATNKGRWTHTPNASLFFMEQEIKKKFSHLRCACRRLNSTLRNSLLTISSSPSVTVALPAKLSFVICGAYLHHINAASQR